MKNIPEEIDLYDWYDYSFLRAVLKLPIPSPRVWDNAGAFGFTGGKYLKDPFEELQQLCKFCKITGDCDTLPFCTKSQKTCEWRQNWDGKWIQECKSF